MNEKLKRIFGFKDISYDAISSVQEQECLFVEVETARSNVKQGLEIARVTGKLRFFANSEKVPYGFFAKKIEEADFQDTANFFFYEFEDHLGTIGNICERTLSFVFLYNGQYNPDAGSITSIELEET